LGKNYINVYESDKDVITHVYVEDGVRKVEKEIFQPFCAVNSVVPTGWTDIHGRDVNPKMFRSMSDYRAWKKENDGLFDIYGDVKPEYQFIAKNYRETIVPNKEGMNIYNFDIEVEVPPGSGFPDTEQALFPINAITIQNMVKDRYYSFAYKKPKALPDGVDVVYVQCESEIDMLDKFLKFWTDYPCDIMTGWNIRIFDIPYLINRLNRVCGSNTHLKLSPCRKIGKHESKHMPGEFYYVIRGVTDMDYIELYKKFTYESRERYSLDYIAQYELGKEKIKFKEDHEDLYELYHQDFTKFLAYNIKDVELVSDLDKKLKYIDLALFVMYKAKCLPEDIFGTVKIWDSYLYNVLMDRKIFCPPNKRHSAQEYPGGYVGDPEVGMHRWVMVFDVASSYPNQIRSYNMSPETIIDEHQLSSELRDIRANFGSIEGCLDQDILEKDNISEVLQRHNVSMAPNGHFFDISQEGILPGVIGELFNERKSVKKSMGLLKKELEDLRRKLSDGDFEMQD